MRAILLLAVILTGCTPTAPTPDEIQPFIAVDGTYGVLASSTTPPAPPPPVQGDVCPDCYGRKMVGDGTNMTKCLRCNGTGKITKEAASCPTPKSTSR